MTKGVAWKNAGSTRQKMRLDIARKAIADLERGDTLTADQRLELYRLIERMTGGKPIKPAKKQGIFG